MPITPKTGSLFHAESHIALAGQVIDLWRLAVAAHASVTEVAEKPAGFEVA